MGIHTYYKVEVDWIDSKKGMSGNRKGNNRQSAKKDLDQGKKKLVEAIKGGRKPKNTHARASEVAVGVEDKTHIWFLLEDVFRLCNLFDNWAISMCTARVMKKPIP